MSSSVLETKTYFFNRLGLEYGSTMFDLGNLKGKGYIRGLLRGKTTKRLKSHFVGTLFFWMSLNGSRPSNLWLHKFIVLLITLSIYCRHSPFVLLISFFNPVDFTKKKYYIFGQTANVRRHMFYRIYTFMIFYW